MYHREPSLVPSDGPEDWDREGGSAGRGQIYNYD